MGGLSSIDYVILIEMTKWELITLLVPGTGVVPAISGQELLLVEKLAVLRDALLVVALGILLAPK